MNLRRFVTKRFLQKHSLFFFALILQFFFVTKTNAQADIKDLRVIGNFVQFSYNTFDHFENGITLTGWTRARIKFRYDGSSGWELRMWAMTTEIEYEGAAGNNIDLSDLEITPIITNTTDATASINALFALDVGPYDPVSPTQVIADGDEGTVGLDPAEDIELTITYKLGAMINKPEGLYFVNLVLLLVEK
jgi:hypothetical protein